MRLTPFDPNYDQCEVLAAWESELEQDYFGRISIQYELIHGIMSIRRSREEFWSNWNESFYPKLMLLSVWLGSSQVNCRVFRDAISIMQTADRGPDVLANADDSIDRLTEDVFRWCMSHMNVVPLPPEYETWSHVPRDIV